MTPTENIIAQVKTIMKSKNFHMLIVEGRAGFGKTTAVMNALSEIGIKPAVLGSYSTPLGFFNYLSEHQSSLILIDDTSGIFASPFAMSILKSATWDHPGRGRVVRWNSTSEKASTEEFIFDGKLVVICNSFPKNFDAEAVRNRSLEIQIEPNLQETKELLTKASKEKLQFPDQKIAQKILKDLLNQMTEQNYSKVSYRTLQRNYEVAIHNPDSWEKMNSKNQISASSVELSHKIILSLNKSGLKVKDQLSEFEKQTGFKRRSFFKYRKQLGLADE